jgi:outer membrane protein OmpA-like peptidoglycan-associated protein
MANILENLAGMLSPELMGTIGKQLNESPSGVESALGGILPSILGGMVQKAEGGNFSGIFNMLKGSDNFELSDLIGMMGSGNLAHNDPRDAGGGLIGALLGDKTGGLIDAISGMAGINKKSSSSLLGMAAPFIMSFLAKKIRGEKLDAGGLASMFLGQKGSIMAAIPSVLSAVLGFGQSKAEATLGAAKNTATRTVSAAASTATGAASTAANTATAAASSGMGFLKWLLPLLLIGALAWFGLRSCDTSGVTAGIENAGGAMSDMADKAGDAAGGLVDGAVEGAGDLVDGAAAMGSGALSSLKETANGLWELVLPGGVKIEANKDGVEYSLIDFISSDKAVDNTSWFNFDALRFATGSSSLDADFSKRQIENMVAVMTAYPDVHLKIGGYTDNVGNPASNMKLSQKRANNVMATLIDKGIDASRLSAEGFGEQHPACPANDTPECKAQNRRIAARVTQK